MILLWPAIIYSLPPEIENGSDSQLLSSVDLVTHGSEVEVKKSSLNAYFQLVSLFRRSLVDHALMAERP
jgi:hypothetical protein